jgi:Ca2+-binding RTX toxin-like protein
LGARTDSDDLLSGVDWTTNVIYAEGGNDTIYGKMYNDTINGGLGSDSLFRGFGSRFF